MGWSHPIRIRVRLIWPVFIEIHIIQLCRPLWWANGSAWSILFFIFLSNSSILLLWPLDACVIFFLQVLHDSYNFYKVNYVSIDYLKEKSIWFCNFLFFNFLYLVHNNFCYKIIYDYYIVKNKKLSIIFFNM